MTENESQKSFVRFGADLSREELVEAVELWLVESGIMTPPEGWVPPEDWDPRPEEP